MIYHYRIFYLCLIIQKYNIEYAKRSFYHMSERNVIDPMFCAEKFNLEIKQHQTPYGQQGVEISIAFAPIF